MKPILDLKNISKKFDDKCVIDDISLTINKGDIFGIIGLSGAGKSTLVRCINGLENVDSGEIYYSIDGENQILLTSKDVKVNREYKKKISMIFQNFNLLDQRNVLENVLIAGEISKISNKKEKALALIKLVGLEDKIKYYPSTLSGGEKQRVAIARALMNDPSILLCDEATSALDPETTHSILTLLKDLNTRFGLTIIIIAHQMSVIEKVCNNVAILDQAKLVEVGPLYDVFLNPKSDIARKFIYGERVNTNLDDGRLLRFKFDGDTTDQSLIANLILDCNVLVSILVADTKVVDGKTYGQLILKVPSSKFQYSKIIKYLKLKNIDFEEISSENSITKEDK